MVRAGCLILCLTACAGAPSRGSSTETGPVQADSAAGRAAMAAAQSIAQLEGEWRRALASGDTAFFARTLAENFLLTGGHSTLSKAEFLGAVAADSGRIPPSRPEGTNVRLFGTVAVVTGLLEYEIPGQRLPVVSRYTEVWMEQAGRWRAVHGHYNPLPSAPAAGR
jgi:ketosteroid isomerase-like protein